MAAARGAALGLVWGAAAGFAAFLAAVGAYLGVKGAQLAGLGGSPYYLIAGIALIAVAALLMLRSVWSARLLCGDPASSAWFGPSSRLVWISGR